MRDRHVFVCKSVEILNIFYTLTFKQIFSKTQTLFKKPEYCFLVESTKIGNASFPSKTALLEANIIRQIECGVQNEPITKNGVLPVTTLFFRKFCYNLRNSYKELIWFTNQPSVYIHTFREHWSFIWGCFLSVCILKKFGFQIAI